MEKLKGSNFLYKRRRCRCDICKTLYTCTLAECETNYFPRERILQYTLICKECGKKFVAYKQYGV